jgi:hypothetical protein
MSLQAGRSIDRTLLFISEQMILSKIADFIIPVISFRSPLFLYTLVYHFPSIFFVLDVLRLVRCHMAIGGFIFYFCGLFQIEFGRLPGMFDPPGLSCCLNCCRFMNFYNFFEISALLFILEVILLLLLN